MTSVSSVAELIHLGMDTSVKEIVVAVLRPGEEVPVVDRIPGDEESVRRLIGRFPDRRLLSACYEAGPGGYELHRLLTSMGGGLRCGRPVADPQGRLGQGEDRPAVCGPPGADAPGGAADAGPGPLPGRG